MHSRVITMFPLMKADGSDKTQKLIFTSRSLTFVLAGQISSCTPLVKTPSLLLDRNWLPGSRCKAQAEKFKPISFPSIRETLQQLLSPEEQGKSALRFFPPTIEERKNQPSEWNTTEGIGKNLHSRIDTAHKQLKFQYKIWFAWPCVSWLRLIFQE